MGNTSLDHINFVTNCIALKGKRKEKMTKIIRPLRSSVESISTTRRNATAQTTFTSGGCRHHQTPTKQLSTEDEHCNYLSFLKSKSQQEMGYRDCDISLDHSRKTLKRFKHAGVRNWQRVIIKIFYNWKDIQEKPSKSLTFV